MFFFEIPESPLTTGLPYWLETSLFGLQATMSPSHVSCAQGGQLPLLATLVKAPSGYLCFGRSQLSGSRICSRNSPFSVASEGTLSADPLASRVGSIWRHTLGVAIETAFPTLCKPPFHMLVKKSLLGGSCYGFSSACKPGRVCSRRPSVLP